jgi:hypothetical protein
METEELEESMVSSSSMSLPEVGDSDFKSKDIRQVAFKIKKEVYSNLKFKKVKLEMLKYFKRLHRLMATKKKKNANELSPD